MVGNGYLLALGAASSDRLARLAVLALLGETCRNLVSTLFSLQRGQLTKEVEVLNELPLGASLVRGTKDISQQTTGEDTAQDAISLDVRLVQAASSLAAITLGLVLVDGSGRAVGSNAEGEGEGSDNGGEVHCDSFRLLEMNESVQAKELWKREKMV